MKRIGMIGILLTAFLLYTTALPVFAQNTIPYETEAAYTASVSVPVSELYPGDTVYITISLSEPVLVYGAELTFSYDADALNFQKVAAAKTNLEEIVEIVQQPAEGDCIYAYTHKGKEKAELFEKNAFTVTFAANKSGLFRVQPKRLKIVQEDMSFQILDLTQQEVNITVNERVVQPSVPPQHGGGGGGGGGGAVRGGISVSGGNAAAAQPPSPTEIPDEPVMQEDGIRFSDLDKAPWAKDAILELAEKEIINGKDEESFAPLDYMTRAEAAKLLTLAFAFCEGEGEEKTFADVDPSSWYGQYVLCAAQNGIILGDEQERFDPDRTIKREEFAAMLARVLAAKKAELPAQRLNVNFKDEAEISDYAVGYVDLLYTTGILEGDDGYFYPQSPLNRAEAAVAVQRILTLLSSGGDQDEV